MLGDLQARLHAAFGIDEVRAAVEIHPVATAREALALALDG